MTKIAHISDLHFGREDARVQEGLLQSLNICDPDLIIVSGDLTQRAKHSEFQAAAEFMANLSWPWLAVPGNHDLPTFNLLERISSPWEKWQHHVGRATEFHRQVKGAQITGINSARRLSSPLDWSRGRINESQLDYLDSQLDCSDDTSLRLLVVHHPFWLPISQQRRHLIHGRDNAIKRLKAAGVDMILSGHVHLAYSRVCEGLIVSHAGTAISDRLLPDIHNSFNVIEGNRLNIRITEMLWNGSQFQNAERHHFQRDSDGWRETSGAIPSDEMLNHE